jgi:hypothetical protein
MAILLVASVPAVASERGLHTPPGAIDVLRESSKDTASVYYYVRESYPATRIIAFIENSLAERRWHPVAGADVGPHERSSLEEGWRELPTENSRVLLQVWSARWVNTEGSEVTYTLLYSSKERLRPTHVAVYGLYRSKERADRQRAEIERFAKKLRTRATEPSPSPCPE